MRMCLATVALVLLVGCGTVSRTVRLEAPGTPPRVFTPPRVQPVEVTADAFKAALTEQGRQIRPPARVQEAARRLFAMEARHGTFAFDPGTGHLTPFLPDSRMVEGAPSPQEPLTLAYLNWCGRTGRSGDCLHLLEESTTLDGDGRFALALALAKGAVLDEMLEAFRDMADPHAMVSAVLWTCTTYMLLLTVPEPMSKGVAAVMTATLIAYVGVDTFWHLITGFKRLIHEAEQATTFDELRKAGERYGQVMGRNAARAFAMLATVALGNTAAGLSGRGPPLPNAAAARLMAATQGGFRLESVGLIHSVAVSSSGTLTIALAPIAVAMSSQGTGGSKAAGASHLAHPTNAPVDVRPPASRHNARQVDQRTLTKETNSVVEPRVDVNADIAAIRAGRADIGRTPGGEVSYRVNGRTYGAHSNGTLYPIEGDGIHVLGRGAFKALGVYNQHGNTTRAAQILDNMGIGATERRKALSVWETYPSR